MHGPPTRRALELTSRLTEAICALPAVSSPDWCDRAAEVLARIAEPGAACVAIGSVTSSGKVLSIECCGAASPKGGLVSGVRLDEQRLLMLRAKVQALTEVGAELGRAVEGMTVCELASGLARGQDWRSGAIGQLWAGIDPRDVLAGAHRIGQAGSDRVVLCFIAPLSSAWAVSEVDQAIARTVLPRLAARALIAIGPDAHGADQWLTPKEYLVLKQIILGKSVRRIADEIGRSPHTVHDHVKSLHRKLGASSRGELVARALGYLGPVGGLIEAKPAGGRVESAAV